jgi:dipeptidase D
MSKVLGGLKPERLWNHFEDICGIPHPSKKEGNIIKFMKEFGEKLGLETHVDEVGNVIIRKPATTGMENRTGIILQGHLDMVPQKNSDKNHDFEKDPILPRIEGEWVKATGTTLGADNGMGVCAAMAILESKDLSHGPVEALFTIDEETGMTGAFGLKPGLLKGDILINLDSEEEGELCIGCAGGTNANITFKYKDAAVQAGMAAYKISVTGLKGGHSGVDIHLGRGNSNKILFRFLRLAERKFGLRLASIDGGSLRNAIPRESFAVVVFPQDKATLLTKDLKEFEASVRKELSAVEPDLKFVMTTSEMPKSLIDADTQKRLINAVLACPNEVIRMSNEMEGLVETSTNLAIVKSENGTIKIQCLLRSSVDSAKEYLENRIEAIFELAGADVILLDGRYPGWKPNPSSAILKTMKDLYTKQFGKVPGIYAIHAGLECGLLGGVYPNFDMVSCGPTIKYPHSPDEMVHIESVKKFWDFLVETLKNAPVK